MVKHVDLICHLWQQYINVALLPLASSSVTVRREMVQFNNQTVNRIETATNNLLQKLTDCEFFNPWKRIYGLNNPLSRGILAVPSANEAEEE